MPYSVLHVGKYYPPFAGGIEHFMADLLPALIRLGWDASAIVHNESSRSHARIEDLSLPNCIPSVRSEGDESLNPAVYRVPGLGRFLYTPISPRFPLWLARAIRAERPGIIHLHMPNVSAFWALLLPSARRLPWVVHWHSDVVGSRVDRRLRAAYPLYRPFEQQVLKRARAVVATSPPYLESSRALSAWSDKCSVIPLGLDSSRIPELSDADRADAESRWHEAKFRILTVGRLTYYKGHEHLIEAMKDLAGSRAIMVGEGDRRKALERITVELGVEGQVSWPGKLPARALQALFASCDCVCLPSIERTEAFGLVLLEAMAHGKPAVVCDIPGSGVSWVVQDHVNGLVVPPACSPALAHALGVLAKDRDSSTRMGEAGRKRYENEFSIEHVASRVGALYEDILSEI